MSPSDSLPDDCQHNRSPLLRLGKVKRGGKTLYMLLCTECGFAISTEELRILRAAHPGPVVGPSTLRKPPEYCGYGWAARRAREGKVRKQNRPA